MDLTEYQVKSVSEELRTMNNNHIREIERKFRDDKSINEQAETIITELNNLSVQTKNYIEERVSYGAAFDKNKVITVLWEAHRKTLKDLFRTDNHAIVLAAIECNSLPEIYEKMRL